MSPYVRPNSLAQSAHCAGTSLAPTLASIGTVLIDAFDTLPRPVVDPVSPSSPSGSFVPSSPSEVPLPSNGNGLHSLFIPPYRFRFSPPLSPATSGTSGPLTPQLSFDDIPLPNAQDIYEMLGGGALFALVGARIWLPPNRLKAIVDRAPEGEEDDCPKEIERKLIKLGKEIWVWNRNQGTKMTRARIRYEGDVRYFQQVVKAPYRTMAQLAASPLNNAEYLHVAPPYSPEDVCKLLKELDALPEGSWRPKIIFEPTPPSCHPEQKDWLEKILPGLEVLSPNHEELLSFYGQSPIPISDPALRPTVEGLITYLLHDVGIGANGQGIIVVRCGRLGACIGTKANGLKWCPAFFERENAKRIKDVTGAGNSFLGGYAAGLSLTGCPYEAMFYATVSASFIVEQFGLPSLMDRTDPMTGEEIWNADTPSRRLAELKRRVESL